MATDTESDPTPTAFAAVAPEPAPLPSSLTAPITLHSIVSDVLRWFGLPTVFADGIPATPVPPPLETLWFFVRRVEYTVANDAPVATHSLDPQDLQTGVITGRIDATDTDGDTLTYTVSEQPTHGTVTLDQQGNFVYTPNDTTAENGGTDTFTVTVDDRPGNPPHAGGGITTETIQLVVAPVNQLPSILESLNIDNATPAGPPLFTSDGTRALVTINGRDSDTGRVIDTHLAVIDTATGALAGGALITLRGEQLGPLVLNTDQTRAYLSTTGFGLTQFAVIDLATGTPIGEPITALGTTTNPPVFTNNHTRAWLITDHITSHPPFTDEHATIITLIDTGERSTSATAV